VKFGLGDGANMKKLLCASSFALLALFGSAQAADQDLRQGYDVSQTENTNEDFGHIYSGAALGYFPDLAGKYFQYGIIGGRYAHDPLDHSVGYQFDGGLQYSISGSTIQWAQGTAHITHMTSDEGKIGAFVGLDKTNTVSLGIEGMLALSENTWAQAQVAALDPTQLGFLGSELGFGAGASIHHKLNDNFNLRVDGNYNNFPNNGLSAYGFAGTVQYTFDDEPITIGLSNSYNRLEAGGVGLTEYISTAKVQYSFGGPTEGATGKLFRTNVLGLTP
jgi:hypothetical protein